MSQHKDCPDDVAVIECIIENFSLVRLLGENPLHKQELADKLDVSPNTVYRKTRKLRALDLLKHGNSGYYLTKIGEAHVNLSQELVNASNLLYAGEEFIENHEADNFPPYWEWSDVEIVHSDQYGPSRPMQVVREFVEGATQLCGFSPVVYPGYVNIFYREIVHEQLKGKLILDTSVIEILQSDFGDEFSEARRAGTFSIYEAQHNLPFGLLLRDESKADVLVSIYGTTGDLRGIIKSEATKASQWGRITYEKVADRATPINDSKEELTSEDRRIRNKDENQ